MGMADKRLQNDSLIWDLEDRIKKAQECIKHAIQLFGIEGCAASFNGGKDCTVLLDLLVNTIPNHKWPVCYVAQNETFDEVEDFIVDCEKRYPVNICRLKGDMRSAFETFLASNPQIKCIFIGVRRRDPFCEKLHEFDPTDNGWPQFIRCNPIIDWSFAEVWSYIFGKSVPYCALYDDGYTSIGSRKSTVPNPNLRTLDGAYRPAYTLEDETWERAGRL